MTTTDLTATASTETGIQVIPLSGWTGALIDGVDISAPLSDAAKDVIRTALHKWKVVFFRDQQLDHAAQVAFGAQFGEVTPAHPYEGDSAPAGFRRSTRCRRPPTTAGTDPSTGTRRIGTGRTGMPT